MSDTKTDTIRSGDNMLTIEQLRSFPDMEQYSDEELKELAIFLKEFSLICYDAFIKNNVDKK